MAPAGSAPLLCSLSGPRAVVRDPLRDGPQPGAAGALPIATSRLAREDASSASQERRDAAAAASVRVEAGARLAGLAFDDATYRHPTRAKPASPYRGPYVPPPSAERTTRIINIVQARSRASYITVLADCDDGYWYLHAPLPRALAQ
jgi:hypothetical protein